MLIGGGGREIKKRERKGNKEERASLHERESALKEIWSTKGRGKGDQNAYKEVKEGGKGSHGKDQQGMFSLHVK